MSTRKTKVQLGTSCRLVEVDYDSYELTVEAIRKKWNLTGNFVLQGGEKGEQIDIVDDGDLQHFKDADILIIHLLTDTIPGEVSSYPLMHGHVVERLPPPPYESQQVHVPQDGKLPRERRISVFFEGINKRVSVDMDSFENTKDAIRQKCSIPSSKDFDVQGKLRGEDKCFDIEDDSDLVDIADAEHLIAKCQSDRPVTQPKDGGAQLVRERKMSVSFEDTRKLVRVDLDSLENTRDAIREKIPVDEEFDLQGKLRGEDSCFDIENDKDLEDIDEAEYLIVRRKSDTLGSGLPSEPNNVEAEMKDVYVLFNDMRNSIRTDLRSLEKIKQAIAQTFGIDSDFEIVAKRLDSHDYPPYQNIHDDSDLYNLKDAVELIVQLTPLSQEQMPSTMYAFPVMEHASYPSVALQQPSSDLQTTEPSSSNPAMKHSESAESQPGPLPQVLTEPKKCYIKCGERCKAISVYSNMSVKDIRALIRQKLNIGDDFRLLAKEENGTEIDIDEDDDLDYIGNADELKVIVTKGDTDESQQDMDIVVTPGAAREETTRQSQDVMTYADQEQAKKTMVQYRGTEYSLFVPPEKGSQIVEEQERDLAGNFNVTNILDQLDSTADCLRLAYLGVLGDKELHKIVTDMQFDVLRLGKLCDNTIVEFRIKSGSIIEDLESGFAYLFAGHDQFALSNFKSIGETSKNMLDTTKKLKRECDVKAKHIAETLAKVIERHEGVCEPMPILSNEAEANLEKRIKAGEQAATEWEKKCNELQEEINDTKERFSKEGDIGDNIFKWIEQGIAPNSGLIAVAKGNEEMLENIAKEGRLRALEKAEEAHAAEIRANKEMVELVQQMKRLNPSDDKEGIFAMALRGAETGVKNLQASLEAVASFWQTLSVQCNNITGDKMEKVLEHACNTTGQNTENPFWSLTPFKLQAVRFYAKWVAIRKTCDKFHTGMEKVEKGIQLCFRDNPNVEEARNRIPKLMNEFNQKTQDRTQFITEQKRIAAADKSEVLQSIKSG